MQSKAIKILISFIFLLVFCCQPVLAKIDVSIDSTSISFSRAQALDGETVRIFTRVFNVGDEDVYGFVKFLGNGQAIGDPQPISVKINTYDDVFIDWLTRAGNYEIQAEIISTNPLDDNSANNVAVIQNYFVDLDTDKDGVGNTQDNDDDNDGLSDEQEQELGTDSLKLDSDGDEVNDKDDVFPLDSNETKDNDNDNIGDNADSDDDNDGYTDEDEQANKTDPFQASSFPEDNDNDKISNILDKDDDNDGVLDTEDAFPFDADESQDSDNDGIGDNADSDDDNDGLSDEEEQALSTDLLKPDSDEDGLSDKDEVEQNLNPLKPDTDDDSVIDGQDIFPLDSTESQDADEDGVGDNADINDQDKAPVPVLVYEIQDKQVVLNAQDSYDNDGQIVKYEWDLGDGQRVAGSDIKHEYQEPGEYQVVLAVTDNVGQITQSQVMIKIEKVASNNWLMIALYILIIVLVVRLIILSRRRLRNRKQIY